MASMNEVLTSPLLRAKKHRLARVVAGTLVGLSIVASSFFSLRGLGRPAHAASGDWPSYMGDIGRTSYNWSETIVNSTSAPGLKLQWTSQAGRLPRSRSRPMV